ncbi:lanthionine synthetase LanC family protein [Kribbella monticola]|uniref:lanthionine synthetase LanC family protein n=1 Tax=Kribbella monticola TaxID=2185285 RepID=UPI0018E5373E|nr:lanthionine synthetase LanC family protein [Kribbella monticola]
MTSAGTHREVADAAWRWVLDQIRWDDGPWIPESSAAEIPEQRDGTYAGTGGLVQALAEIRLSRPWTAEEQTLVDAIAERLRAQVPTMTDYTYFDGLVSAIGVFTTLGIPGTTAAVRRLSELAEPDGWPQTILKPPRVLPGSRFNDLTLGTAGVLLGALWALRHGVEEARELADRAADLLLVEGEPVPGGTNWPFVPVRFASGKPFTQMPNLSHGLAGIATALALAGAELGRPELTSAATDGAKYLVSLGVTDGQGLVVPRYIPDDESDEDKYTYNWCHGASGTSLLFLALDQAEVKEIAGEPPLAWHRRCLHSVRTSGLPARLHPGFWDNDGRCCGTAGVGDLFLDSWLRSGETDDLRFALQLADTLVDRAVWDGPYAYWRFLEHRADEPLLPPGIGWMQGAAGIATFLFRASRLSIEGPNATVIPRMETWWTLPAQRRQTSAVVRNADEPGRSAEPSTWT